MNIVGDITNEHIRWAHKNGAKIEEGECGFGRECVGVTKDGHWIEYQSFNYDPKTYEILSPKYEFWEGFVPPRAYHKHPCLAVLGQDNESWYQLSRWLDAIIEAECTIDEYETDYVGLAAILTGNRIPYLKLRSVEGESFEL